MNEVEYELQEEARAQGQFIADVAKAIFDAFEADTMASLQRRLYKDTSAGIAISFDLHDGSKVWVDDARAHEIKDPWNWVRMIGVSSIVEGSDALVPLTWFDLRSYLDADKYGEDVMQVAVHDFEE